MIFVYIFLGLVALLLFISALLPKSYNIEKSVVVDRPPAEVMNYVGDLGKYAQWNPWQKSDPTAKFELTGTPKLPGHKYTWDGKKVGKGSLTLTGMDDKHVHIDLEFIKPFKNQGKDNWLFEPWGDGNHTKVTWQNTGGLPWPIASLIGPMLIKGLNVQFDKGLDNLKKMAETS